MTEQTFIEECKNRTIDPDVAFQDYEVQESLACGCDDSVIYYLDNNF